MLHLVLPTRGITPVTLLLQARFGGKPPPLRLVEYSQMIAGKSLTPGTYLFTSAMNLESSQLEALADTEAELAKESGFRLLNRPSRVVSSIEFHQRLLKAPSASEPPARFPVLLRASGRGGIRETPPLDCLETYRIERARLVMEGFCPERMWQIEMPPGYHEPLSSLKVGRELLMGSGLQPYRQGVAEAFTRCRLDVGRIDFLIRQGRLHLWRSDDTAASVFAAGIDILPLLTAL